MFARVAFVNFIFFSLVFGMSFQEYIELCERYNEAVVGVSADGQTMQEAYGSALLMAYDELTSKEMGAVVNSKSYLNRAYEKVSNKKISSETFTKRVEVSIKGIIFPVKVKEKFFPKGDGSGLGYAKVWVKKNCKSLNSYEKFKQLFDE